MDVEVTKLPESRVTLSVTMTPQEVDAALDRTYKQLVQRVTIPGFRKGKAPRDMLERMIGREYFLHEATEEAVRWGYRKAVEQAQIQPIDEAEIEQTDEHDHVESSEAYTFTATVAVKPDVQLPDYHTIQVDREEVNVSDSDVEEMLHDLQERTATLEPTVRPAQIGDVVTLNVTGKLDGEQVLHNENLDFNMGTEEEPDPVLPGLAQELVGANRGDIRDIALPLPELYANQEWAGKTMLLNVLVKEIKRKVLPELNDEFAQTVSHFETLDELREALRNNLAQEKKYAADQKLVNDVVEAVSSRSFVDIPPMLIDEEIDRMLEELERSFEQARLSVQAYLDTTGKSVEDLRSDMRDDAIKNVKTTLVLGAVADSESIDVSNSDVDADIEAMVRTLRLSSAERRRLRQSANVRSNIRSRLRRQRAIRRLAEIIGGEDISEEAAEAVVEETASAADDTEETVAVEVGT